MSGALLLAVDGLSKSWGGVQAVREVSFTLAAGEMLALIGPNGAGKSTCFNMLNGHVQPDAGRVMLAGQEITGLSPARIWALGVGRTFQITATFASMTVRENVQMGLLTHRRKSLSVSRWFLSRAGAALRAEADELLALVDMLPQAHRLCAELAYGDLKRLELALALTNAPRLLLMDEPTAGMAAQERTALMRLTSRIARERGLGVLFTEHDMDVVFGEADRVMVLDRGVLIAQGAPADVRANERVRAVYLGEDIV